MSAVTVLDPDTAERAARQFLDARVTAVRELAARRADLTQAARDAVIAAERADAAVVGSPAARPARGVPAWAAAERSGWTETDLRRVGFEPPTTRAPGRPKRATRVSSAATAD